MVFTITTRIIEQPAMGHLSQSMANAVAAAHELEPFTHMSDLNDWVARAFVSPWLSALYIHETSTVQVRYKQELMFTAQQVHA